jgi:hypothetical protein
MFGDLNIILFLFGIFLDLNFIFFGIFLDWNIILFYCLALKGPQAYRRKLPSSQLVVPQEPLQNCKQV